MKLQAGNQMGTVGSHKKYLHPRQQDFNTHLQYNHSKWTGGIEQVTEQWICMYKTSNSNSSDRKKIQEINKSKSCFFKNQLGWGCGSRSSIPA
jgi:hypothetical protein